MERLTSVLAVPVIIRGEVQGILYGAGRDRAPINERTARAATVLAGQLQQEVETHLSRSARCDRRLAGELSFGKDGPMAELAAVIRDTRDPHIRARLVRIQHDLSSRQGPREAKASLSPREVDTLQLVAVGASNLEIAARLGLSVETVKAYLRSALRKLEVHNRTAAAHQARLQGLL